MKLYFTVILFAVNQNTVCSQVYVFEKKYKNHLEASNLNGKVKTVTEIYYKGATFIHDSIKNAKLDYFYIMDYNQFGNLTEKRCLDRTVLLQELKIISIIISKNLFD